MKKTPYNQISNYASGSTVQISLEVSDNASTALPDLSAPFGAPKEPTVSKEPSVPNTECLSDPFEKGELPLVTRMGHSPIPSVSNVDNFFSKYHRRSLHIDLWYFEPNPFVHRAF